MTRPLFLLSLLLVGCQTHTGDPELGQRIYRDTPRYAAAYVTACKLSCVDCHNGLPLDGVAARYPAFNPRAGRDFTLEDRISECFRRSENGTAPPPGSPEMEGMKAYLASLTGAPSPQPSPPADLPLASLSAERGHALYVKKCASCHQNDGNGSGPFPPVWGPASYNDGAGMGNVYKLARFVEASMPLGQGHTLTPQEAQDVALFIDSQPRPVFAGKAQDFPGTKPPPGSVYYR